MKSNQTLFFSLLTAVALTVDAYGGQLFPVVTNHADTCASVASDGTNYLIGIQGDYAGPSGSGGGTFHITAQMFGPTGALIGSRINPVPTHTGGNSFLACSGTNYLMVWPDDYLNGNNSSISAQLISSSGNLLGGMLAITANSAQEQPQVAYGAGKYLVTWNDLGGGINWAVYGQLVSASGSLISGNFLICAPADGSRPTSVSAAFDGTNFLVAWVNVISLYTNNVTDGVFVSPSGAVGTPFAISQTVSLEQDPLAVVFNGSDYLVVWNFENPNLGIYDLYGRFVTPAGTFRGNEFAITTNQSKAYPFLAYDGANYLLSWDVNANVQFQFLNSSGQPTGPQFTPFTAQRNEVPLLAPVLYDGNKFVSVATLSANGWLGTSAVEIYGTFIPASTTPPQFDTGTVYTSDQCTLTVTGTPGINYAIQIATNLVGASWTSLATNSPTNGAFTFTDTGATNPSRFYRAVKQ